MMSKSDFETVESMSHLRVLETDYDRLDRKYIGESLKKTPDFNVLRNLAFELANISFSLSRYYELDTQRRNLWEKRYVQNANRMDEMFKKVQESNGRREG